VIILINTLFVKTKLLFIHHATGWGGAPISMISLIKNLDREKFEIKVLLIRESMVADKLKENNINYSIAESVFYKRYYQYLTHSEADYIKYHQVYKLIKLSLFWLLSRLYFAKRELAKHDYDIAHLNSSVLTDWLAPAKERGKVIIHIREPLRKGRFDILRSVYRTQMRKYADHIVAISKDNARRVNLPKKTTLVYNYIEATKKEPSEDSYASKKVLYLGGSASIKGYHCMVDALDYLEEDVRVYFGGDYSSIHNPKSNIGKLKHTAKHLLRRKHFKAIKKMHSHPKATVIGLTQNVYYHLGEVCCLVSPFSVPHFSRPIIEAYLHKKPVIGSDVEGMSEIIEHEVTGLIVPRNNPRALAQAINDLTANKVKAKNLGESGLDFVKGKFNNNFYQFMNIYDAIYPNQKSS
jgi:glycosyltransferase involved in cell wall biosynthesis